MLILIYGSMVTTKNKCELKGKFFLFRVVKREKSQMTSQSESSLDATDWRILRELQKDARLSYNELGRRVALSAPAAAERVRKLEERGIITGYGAQVDPAKVGLPILAFIQLRCGQGKCLFQSSKPEDFPEILEIHILASHYCSILKVAVSSMQHFNALKDRIEAFGTVVVNIVTSTQLANRTIDWEDPDVNLIPPFDAGWVD
jgi:Lrp/AsnC family leucine-responsive transcriptional regulator